MALLEMHLAVCQIFPGAFSFSEFRELDSEELDCVMKRHKACTPKKGINNA
jgi:hypothetical protein